MLADYFDVGFSFRNDNQRKLVKLGKSNVLLETR